MSARLVARRLLGETIGDHRRREDLTEEGRQLSPFLILTAASNRLSKVFEALQRFDFNSQLLD
jgi:hypothetical protein